MALPALKLKYPGITTDELVFRYGWDWRALRNKRRYRRLPLYTERTMCMLAGYSVPPNNYPPEFNASFKQFIRERDGSHCRVWGENCNVLCVHHIDYNLENTTARNCITLCRRCHGETNVDRAEWTAKLSQVLSN